MTRVHHTALCPADFEASLRFYRDGLGMEPIMGPVDFEGDWPALFGAPEPKLRSVFLGDPASPDGGIVELVEFAGAPATTPSTTGPGVAGFFLISLYVDVPATLERLAAVGVTDVRRIEVEAGAGTVAMATVRDPDGVVVELIGRPSA
jgi:glyoxylase I family protein